MVSCATAPTTTAVRVFASHEWGAEGETHRRVARIVDVLRQAGVNVWFDETHMKGNILNAMCRGIDQSDLVLVFVTKRYLEKVETGGDDDNVRREFMYAATIKKPMLAIKLDHDCPKHWKGPVGMLLGSSLYVSLCDVHDTAEGDISVDCTALVGAIHASTSRILWKRACRTATSPSASPPPPSPPLLPLIPTTTATTDDKVAKSPPLCDKRSHSRAPPRLRRVAPLVRTAEEIYPCKTTFEAKAVANQTGGMRDRVHRALHAMGDDLREGEHVGGVVDRLFHSLAGSTSEGGAFCDKLARIELELGLAKA